MSQINNIPERCSDIKQLNSLIQVMLNLALADIVKQGVNPLVVETYRSQERQDYLYCQGHTITQCLSVGIDEIFASKHCPVKITSHPTSTINSLHTLRKAVDVVPQRIVKGKMTAIWDKGDKQTQIIIKTMIKYGFEAGANWTRFIDSPHFQVKGLFTDTIDAEHTTPYLTKSVQTALRITADGKWGKNTTNAVNEFRKSNMWTENGKLGAIALKVLLSRLA